MKTPQSEWIGSLGLAVVVLLALPLEARAYTDPGTGALLMQILGGSIVGGIYYLRRLFRLRPVAWLTKGRELTKE